MSAPCTARYVSGFRRGRPCVYRATAIVNSGPAPFRACGYHARAYVPRVVYPLAWSLVTLRRWQIANLDRLMVSAP